MTKENNTLSALQEAMYALADDLGQLVLREHQILQGEMRQVGVLVGDAVKSLDENFRTLNERASEQVVILNKVIESGQVNDEQKHKLSDISNDISTQTSATIRALQFDDIVQQLAGHTCDRIGRMQELFTELEDKLKKIKQLESYNESDIHKYLEMMKVEVGHFRAKLEKENPVKQDSMNAGRIELF